MTRRISANMYMTLDGYAGFPEYPGSDIVSDEPDEAFREMWINRYSEVDTVIFGRRSYEGHLQVHSIEGRKKSDPGFLFDYSSWLEDCNKIVLSRSVKSTGWKNTRIMQGDLGNIISALKHEPGKDIIVDGGPAVIRECIQRGLADDYYALVFPVILGKGLTYWGPMADQRTLKLLSARQMEYGELVLHYETVRQ